MYNFRYHLVTIVSIFAALAIGLLLGVALTGSDLVRDASSNLAKSLTEQFDDLNTKNRELLNRLEREQLFSSQLATGWQQDRLEGRTIVLLTRMPKGEDPLVDELSSLVTRYGGMPVVIRIDGKKGFGLTDKQTLDALRRTLPAVENEDYETTLARALAREWSFAYTTGGASATDAFEANYPLTRQLVESGNIEITVSYRLRIDASVPVGSPESAAIETQRTAYQHAQNLGLPYGVNGIIDTAVYSESEGSPLRVDMLAARIALEFEALGRAGKLPYLYFGATEHTSSGKVNAEQPNKDLSYYALLVQEHENSDVMLYFAQDNGISYVASLSEEYRTYSVIALLTGAEKGIYGLNRPGVQPFPEIPADKHGNAPFR